MRLKGKTALVTGANRNIGKQIAVTFAGEGADLVLNTRINKQELDAVAAQCRELGVNTQTVIGDVSDPVRVGQMVQEGIEALGKIDILVLNVAIRPHKPILEVSNEEWRQVMSVNLDAAFYLIKAVLPGMMERRSGSIIALGGQSAITGRSERATVTTAKTGLLGLIRAVAAEMAPYNIRANIVNPGSIKRDISDDGVHLEPRERLREAPENTKNIPMGRRGTTGDIARACLFFASDESDYITGDRLNVMGGRYIF
jgi:3-oxoacyl-[acyl-carrier protein] reductase